MKYYSHHIGDFNKKTRHLTRLERSIYRDLLEHYYETEKELTHDIPALSRLILARSNEESTAVEQVLNEFFIRTDTGWYHDRCDEEIQKFKSSNSQKSIAGKASSAKRRDRIQQMLNGNSTAVQRTFNGCDTASQLTINHKPLTINQDIVTEQNKRSVTPPHFDPVDFLKSKGVEEKLARDWIAMRKLKRALPTESAIMGIAREAEKASVTLSDALQICCERGWSGFKAEWEGVGKLSGKQGKNNDRSTPSKGEKHDEYEELYG